MINLTTKIEDIVKIQAKMMDFFNEERVDYCCQGYKTVEEVASESGRNKEELLEKINSKLEDLGPATDESRNLSLDDFSKLSTEEMIDSIIDDHHSKERELLTSIDPLLNKILFVHFESHGEELSKLHTLFGALKTELELHFIKEEKITFPLMKANPNPSKEIVGKVEDLEADHEKAGEIIKEMIELTDDFSPPEDACMTFKKTYQDLDALTKDIFVHIFKENSILFEKFKN